MKHAVFGKRLSRDTKARKALLNNLASSLIVHGQLTTTKAKAKFAQIFVEKLITQAKKSKLARSRILASKLGRDAFLKLTQEIGPGFEGRNGGYTRIIKLVPRRGDSAPMAKIELVQWDKSKAKVREVTKVREVRKVSKKKSAKSAKTSAKS